MRLSTDIIRFMTVRVEEHDTEPSPMMRKGSDRDDRRGPRRGGPRGGGFRDGPPRGRPRDDEARGKPRDGEADGDKPVEAGSGDNTTGDKED